MLGIRISLQCPSSHPSPSPSPSPNPNPNPDHHEPHHHNSTSTLQLPTTTNRRALLLLSSAIPFPPLSPPLSSAASVSASSTASGVVTPSPPPSQVQPPPVIDTTITDRVFLDFCICPTYFRSQPTLNSAQPESQPPCTEEDSQPIGRVILGLYGRLVPTTVSNFKSMCTGKSGSSYKNTIVHKILPGQFFVAGRQGRRDKPGPPLSLARNTETVEARAFQLPHSRPGVLSLCLSENDDDDEAKLDPEYHNVEFLITTGPGPCPQLDGRNIVFGTVLEGLDVITSIAATPTYKPAERIRQLNDLAEFFGDERAQNARALWNKPLKSIYISDCGELQVTKPSLSPPSLP